MKYLFNEYNNDDIETIKRQLSTDSISITGIIERCKWGFPSIILLYPLRSADKPEAKKDLNFMSLSTLIWLTCPYLNDRIHKLESEGYIKKVTDFINNNRDFVSKMQFAHAHYFYLRKKVYRYFLGDVSSIDENSRLFNTGIGGISDIENIKCLHLHYAHYRICNENYAGRITYELLDCEIYCKGSICKSDNLQE